jgi:glycosyltransferase involved in cell wall biosynthesis
LLSTTASSIDLLNVGSTAPRKRIDVLLQVFAVVRRHYPNLRLIRVGGRLNARQLELAEALGVRDAIVELPFLSSDVLAAVYRRAALVMCPSEAEGFGLPLLESIACGTPVVASDVGAMREVGGPVAEYARVGDIREWTGIVMGRLEAISKESAVSATGERMARVERAKGFSWHKTAARTVEIYCNLLN